MTDDVARVVSLRGLASDATSHICRPPCLSPMNATCPPLRAHDAKEAARHACKATQSGTACEDPSRGTKVHHCHPLQVQHALLAHHPLMVPCIQPIRAHAHRNHTTCPMCTDRLQCGNQAVPQRHGRAAARHTHHNARHITSPRRQTVNCGASDCAACACMRIPALRACNKQMHSSPHTRTANAMHLTN